MEKEEEEDIIIIEKDEESVPSSQDWLGLVKQEENVRLQCTTELNQKRSLHSTI